MLTVGRGGVVGIATRYKLDDLRIESRLGGGVSAPAQTGPGAYLVSCEVGNGSTSRGKAAVGGGGGVNHPSHLTKRLKKEQGSSCTPPLVPSWQATGWSLLILSSHHDNPDVRIV